MLKGNNRLALNQATMREIVQYWITNKMLNKEEASPVVTDVEMGRLGSERGDLFIVSLGEPHEPPSDRSVVAR